MRSPRIKLWLNYFLGGKESSSLGWVKRRSSSGSCFDMIYGKWDGLMRSPRIKLWLNYFFGMESIHHH